MVLYFEMVYSSPTMLMLWGCQLIMRRRDGPDRMVRGTVLTVCPTPPPFTFGFLLSCVAWRGSRECFRRKCVWKRGVVLTGDLVKCFVFLSLDDSGRLMISRRRTAWRGFDAI